MNSKTNLDSLKTIIAKSKKIALFWHTSPDGDAIWSILWLWNILKKQNKIVSYFTPTKPKEVFDFISEISQIKTEFDYKDYDTLIFLDFTTLKRIDSFFKWHEEYFKNRTTIQIDHHLETPENRITLAIKDSKSISTCELIFEYTNELRPQLLDKNIATHLYMWITTDSWNFRYEKDSIRTFDNALKLVKLWADKQLILNKIYNSQSIWSVTILQRILQRMIINKNFIHSYYLDDELLKLNIDNANTSKALDIMLSIKECEIILLLKIKDWEIRWSLRSKWKYDCTKIANEFWWWWHFKAAWFSVDIEENSETTKINIIKKINNLI
jgi:phosphoesterase RecJ-like protein